MTEAVETEEWWNPKWGPAPRYATRPNPDRKTYGKQTARVGQLLGMKLFPWQAYVAMVAEEVDPETGGPWYDQVVVLAPRRAGKSALIQAVSFRRCAQPGKRINAWMTAQSREAAVRRWKDATENMEQRVGEPILKRYVGVANEQVIWNANASRFRPFAPDEFSMHGEDPDLVFVDEFWKFTNEDKKRIQQGYRPAWLVKPGQEWLLTAAGKPQSEWLAQARMNGRAAVEEGSRSRTAFFEWCIPEDVNGVPVEELPDDDLVELVRGNHPRVDIKVDHLRSELVARGRSEFIRDYGNVDEKTDKAVGLIPPAVMRTAGGAEFIPEDAVVALGVQVDPDRRESSVSAGWRDEEGICHTVLITSEPGTRWVTQDVLAIKERNRIGTVAVRNAGAVRDVADEMERAGISILRVTTPDYTAACNRFVDEILAKTVRHDQDHRLLAAVKAAAWRRRDGGRVYASGTGEPITALDSHTLAVWGFDHLPADENVRYLWSAY